MQRKSKTAFITYRATGKVISTDPSGLKGDTTTWEYDMATGIELRKTYADGKGTVKTYDAYDNLASVADARGVVATCSYDIQRGLLTGISFSDSTPAQKFTYNFLGQLTTVQDAFGARSIGYRRYRCHSHSGDRRSSRGCGRSNSRSCCGGLFYVNQPSRQ